MHAHVEDYELLLSLDRELPPQRDAHVTHHVAACAVCRGRSDRLRSTLQGVDAMYRSGEAPLPSSAYSRVRLESALREAATSPAFRLREWELAQLSRWQGAAAAAVAVVLCSVVVLALLAGTPASGLPEHTMTPGTLPESSLTPGAVSELTAAELCSGVRPSRVVPESVRQQVVQAYGMEQVSAGAYELDALITPELGGSTDAANLWPQRYHSPVWNAKIKDELERVLPQMVCDRTITLAQAQQEIASDWIAAYKRHFKSDAPLRAHLDAPEEEEEELVFVTNLPAPSVALIRLARR
jgi:hypothetical protein